MLFSLARMLGQKEGAPKNWPDHDISLKGAEQALEVQQIRIHHFRGITRSTAGRLRQIQNTAVHHL